MKISRALLIAPSGIEIKNEQRCATTIQPLLIAPSGIEMAVAIFRHVPPWFF